VPTTTLLTIDEFLKLPSSECLRELVRGRLIEARLPTTRHGEVCLAIGAQLSSFNKANGKPWLLSMRAGIVTHREPDSLRGPDVLLYQASRVSGGKLPSSYLAVMPDVVFEVLDVYDQWSDVIERALEFLRVGVSVVCIADFQKESLAIFRDGQAPKLLHAGDTFELPELAGDLRVPVREFFA
jgi:Uma2 family endonuclease